MNSVARFMAMAAVVLVCAVGAQAAVTIETVLVGNAGNTGENSGDCVPGGYGPCRACGAVNYVYRIGKFEITAGQYTEFLNAVAATDTYGLYNTLMWSDTYGCKMERHDPDPPGPPYTYSVAPDWADRPVNFVSWGDAARFCNWLHNGQPGVPPSAPVPQDQNSTEDGSYYLNGATSDTVLLAVVREPDATWVIPSEDEWYKGAHHKNDGVTGNYFDYPTSSDSVPGYVNDSGNLSGTGEGFTEGGTDPGNYATYDGGGEIDGIGSPYYRTKVGEWENSESPYGTFDQGGNIWEWDEAVLDPPYRGIEGGSFDEHDGGLHAAHRYILNNLSFESDSIGFRVAYFADCNANGIPDECDLGCGATIGMTGGSCSVVYPGCGTSTDENGNGVLDDCAPDIPAVSQWGVVAMTLLVLTAGTVVLMRRRRAVG